MNSVRVHVPHVPMLMIMLPASVVQMTKLCMHANFLHFLLLASSFHNAELKLTVIFHMCMCACMYVNIHISGKA